MEKIAVAMSGGVDSSVTAFLLKKMGYSPVGVMLTLRPPDDLGMQRDAEDAQAVADKLGIPFHLVDGRARFEQEVIRPFIDAYACGKTPNPCVCCNRKIKFGYLLDYAERLDCNKIATGHYANVGFDQANGLYTLSRAADAGKDQSYMLHLLTQKQLAKALMPLGGMSKDEVRRIAEENGLTNAAKRDSQDICFIPDGDYGAFITRCADKCFPAGDFVDEQGNALGKHKGLIHYTVGQRKGLGLSFPQPMYVGHIDSERNEVVLCKDEGLFQRTLIAKEVNWISGKTPSEPVYAQAKIRYRHTQQPAIITQIGKNEAQVTFDEPQRAITPGQSVVFYQGSLVLGGGEICKTIEATDEA